MKGESLPQNHYFISKPLYVSFGSSLPDGVLEAANTVHRYQSFETDTGRYFGVTRLLGTERSPFSFVVELSFQVSELSVHNEQLLFDELLKAPQAVDDALDVELLLYFADALIDFVDHVGVCSEFIQLSLDRRDLLEGTVGSNEVDKDSV
jgi:hypothetical protein